ncbi:hypothetical protein [Psittacicella gerlachiana]|uniref:DUF4407 domain-containing protein n=1 Tax=Psittacicella gerlachiana TaxID=2028574 RepID=A0A3A1Y271_9GAMM|nr:hypothetical protein [Psittacicella gerlachiana]RIY31655.1 hypothetical protein CKF59_07470 [Psittacicella gerlachiana]
MAIKDKYKRPQRVPGWIHIILFLFLGISFVETAIGYASVVGTVIAYILSAAVTALLYLLTLDIGRRIIRGQSLFGVVFIFFIFSLITYAGNFNAFYTQFNKSTIFRQELTLHKVELNELQSQTITAVSHIIAPEVELENNVKKLVGQLEAQVLDPQRPGFGQRAKQLIQEISKTLGQPLTELSTSNYRVALEGYKNQIQKILDTRKEDGNYRYAINLANRVKVETDAQVKRIDALLQSGLESRIREEGYGVIQQSVDVYNKLRNDVNIYVNNEELFNLKPAVFASEEIGKMNYAFASAFNDYLFIAILLSVLAFLIDWVAALYLIFIFRGNVNSQTDEDHQAQIRSRRGRTSLD